MNPLSHVAGGPSLEWLQEVPKGWRVGRLKHLAVESKHKCGLVDQPPPMLSVSGYFGVIPKEYDDDNRIRAAEDVVTYLRVCPEQLVANTMWLNFRGLGVSGHHGIVSPAYRAYDLGAELHPPFVHHLLRSEPYVGEYTRLAYGIRPNSLQVSREDFAAIPVAVPPLTTQKAIADFLDRKTAAIDALIEKKQKLLDLLAEKRAALINQAVTKGLDPNVPMKDSGIPWIGEIPAHWEMKRLKFLVTEAVAGPYGASLTKAMYSNSGYRVYGQQQVIPDDFSLGDYYISPEKFAEMQRYLVHPGDLLVSVMGTIGRVAVVPDSAEPGIINPRLVRYRPDESQVTPRFMQVAMLAECSQAYLLLMAQGSTMDGLNMGTLAELALPLPPLEEQHEVLRALQRGSSGVDGGTVSLRLQLERLQEYRQALITAAVTGQLDIPDEPTA